MRSGSSSRSIQELVGLLGLLGHVDLGVHVLAVAGARGMSRPTMTFLLEAPQGVLLAHEQPPR
jgi:hypothetical protein